MALFDPIIEEVNKKFDLGNKARALLSGLLGLITNNQTGGISGFIQRFKRTGLDDLVATWTGMGQNAPLTTQQLEGALGKGIIGQIASKAGVESGVASSALAFMVPKVIDALTPEGAIPPTLPDSVKSYLPETSAAASTPAASTTTSTRRIAVDVDDKPSSGGWLRWLLLLALLGLLGWLGLKYLMPGGGEEATTADTTTPPAAESTTTETPPPATGETTPPAETAVDQANQAATAAGEAASNAAGNVAEQAAETAGAAATATADAANKAAESAANAAKEAANAAATAATAAKDTAADAANKAAEALSAIKPGSSVEDLVNALNLMTIHFATGKATIAPADKDILDKASAAIKAAPKGTVIEIDGHTDNKGNAKANERLSTQRAQAVKAALAKRGISAKSLVAKGYGGANPIADNETEEGRAKNRRIEFKVQQ